jgi:hypothetical protein
MPENNLLWSSDSFEDLQALHHSGPLHLSAREPDADLLRSSDPFQPFEDPELQELPHFFGTREIAGGFTSARNRFRADAEIHDAAVEALKLDGLKSVLTAPLELVAIGDEVVGLQFALHALGFLRFGPFGTFDAEGVMEHRTVASLLR